MNLEARILVVEDDPIVASVFREVLPEHGYASDVVGSAEKGLELLVQSAYDLVITDIVLPGLSGIDLLKRVKETVPDLDVILMTAYANMDSVLEAVEAGVYDYLVKPFESLDDVLATVRRALEKRYILMENRRLVEYLRQANTQIELMNRELERKVVERTEQLREANSRLEQLTVTDDVTALYNQRFLRARLQEEFLRAMRYNLGLAVVMLDLDHFKLVNDTHDHLFGSRVLRRVGHVLRRGVRSTDFVVRYGGDEFVVLLPHAHLGEAVQAAERLRALIEAEDVGDENEVLHVTASAGVAAIGECEAATAEDMLQAADRAMYLAKETGRNRIAVMHGRSPVAVAG